MEVRILFVASKLDPAGMLMAHYLTQIYPFKEVEDSKYLYDNLMLYLTDRDIIYTDKIDSSLNISPELIIFLSRHSAISGTPSLSTHVTGNPTAEVRYGGKPLSLARSAPIFMKSFLIYARNIAEERNLTSKYSVTLEVTHHGPTEINSKIAFVELGSTESEWRDEKAAQVVVDAALMALKRPIKGVPAVGFGGPHYAPLFTRYLFDTDYAFGHILSKYVISSTPREIILDAFRKTENTKVAVINWKGVKSSDRKKLMNILSEEGIEVIKI